MDFKELKKLVDLVDQASISELCIEENGVKIEISKFSNHPAQPVIFSSAMPEPRPVDSQVKNSVSEKSDTKKTPESCIVSPMVGTFYCRPDPNSPPFVSVGDKINKGQVVCIVEAMKLFNEIEADLSGVVEKILVSDGESVEFGQPLIQLKKS